MTSKRKSFVLHKDSLDILPDLTDDQAGKLFKAIYAYQIDEEITLDQIVKMVFLPFKNQFIRDDSKYLETCERRAIAGSKGGKQKVANASNCKQKVANVADSVSKSESKSDSDSKDIDQSEIDHNVTDFCFDQFWGSGIRKVNKKKSKPLFSKILKEYATEDGPTAYDFTTAMVNDIKKRLNSNQLGFAEMHPTTYLNGERWNDEVINNGHQSTGKKESSHERIKRENAVKYGRQDECGLRVAGTVGHLGGAVDSGEGIRTIEQMDNEPFIDY